MMNRLYFLALLLNITFIQQSISQCEPGSAQIALDANNVAAMMNSGGSMWWNGSDGRYEVPQGSGKHTLFAGHLWMGGFGLAGNIRVAMGTYGLGAGQTDYYSGPLDPGGATNEANCLNWDRFFTVSGEATQIHKADYEDNQQIDNMPPNEILGWPAVGNPHFSDIHGFDLSTDPGARYAPFSDVNVNGIYDPMEGDFPLVKGDQNHFFIFNDHAGIHSESGADPLAMEIHVLAYSMVSNNELLNNTTFYDYTMIYRGLDSVSDFYSALWVDPDIGCYSDDYIGSLPNENIFYAYNGDDNDEDCFGLTGYGDDIPVQSFKLLSSRMLELPEDKVSKFNYYLNGATSPNPANADPEGAIEIHNVMAGKWRDGTPLTAGGIGYDPGSVEITDYAFDGSDTGNGAWKECEIATPSGDRRMIMSFGPKTLQPTEVLRFSFASIFQLQETPGCPSDDNLIENGNTISSIIDKLNESAEDLSAKPIALFGEMQVDGSFLFADASLNNPTSWLWDFGNGQTSTEQNPTVVLTGDVLNVCLTATNAFGEDTWCNEVTITQAPVANFSFTITPNTPTNTPVEFTDLSTGELTSWLWDFEDGNTSTEQNPEHIYTQEGLFNVCLTASGPGGQNTSCEEVSIIYGNVDHFNARHGVEIFPNPFADIVNITIDKLDNSEFTFSVYDAIGKKVLSKKMESQSSSSYNLDLKDRAPGVYLLRIESNGVLIGGGKLIKK